ncbi:MAG: PASTA domain-containing protein [Candidatus Saganbacteria bacterium]|nr:PASTA domain-containing protein [Candidatus Saganbacteria bacterium]
MLIEILTFYLIFVIAVSIMVALVISRLKLANPKRLIAAIAAIILLPIPILYFYLTYFTAIPEVVVPDLSGVPFEQAKVELEDLDLVARHGGSMFDMKYAQGCVVSQRPEKGRIVKVGRVVSLLTSSGKRKVAAPNLLGRPLAQAETLLSAKGLVLGEVALEYIPQLEPGMILMQSPLPDEELNVGSLVMITISTRDKKAAEEGKEKELDEDEGGFKLW